MINMALDSFNFDLLCKPQAEQAAALEEKETNYVWNKSFLLAKALSANSDRAFSIYELPKVNYYVANFGYSFEQTTGLDIGYAHKSIKILYALGIVKRKPFKDQWYYMIKPSWAVLFYFPFWALLAVNLKTLFGHAKTDFEAKPICANL